ncbi:MAG: FAD-dependent oxidoreductase [Candidatus Woesearchaeota archaeon]
MGKILSFESKLIESTRNSIDVKTFKFSVPKDFCFECGQFVSAKLDIKGEEIRRAYSIASSPDRKGYIDLCIKKVEGGKGSTYFHNLNKGSKINFIGPMGEFAKGIMEKPNVVFIATGAGIAPFRCIVENILENGYKGKIILFQGKRFVKDKYFEEEFEYLSEKYPNFEYYHIISKPEFDDYQGEKGHVEDLIKKYIPKNIDADYYLCGLFEMIKETTELLKKLGATKDRIHRERYD